MPPEQQPAQQPTMQPQQPYAQPVVQQAAPMQQPLAPMQQQAAPQPIGQHVCWSFPNGKTVFSAVASVATLYPGWLIITNQQTGQELMRFQLAPDLTVRNILGCASITFLAGQKISAFDSTKLFYFYNPRYNFLSYLFGLFAMGKASKFIADCKKAAGAA